MKWWLWLGLYRYRSLPFLCSSPEEIRKEEGGGPVRILLPIAGGGHSTQKDPYWQKARCWESAVLVRGTSRSRRAAERRGLVREGRHRFAHQVAEIFWSNTLLSSCNQGQHFVQNVRGNRKPVQDIGQAGWYVRKARETRDDLGYRVHNRLDGDTRQHKSDKVLINNI